MDPTQTLPAQGMPPQAFPPQGPPPYGQPPQPPMGGYPQPGGPAPKKSKTGLIIAAIVVVLAVAGGVTALLLIRGDDDKTVASDRTENATTTDDPGAEASTTDKKKKTTTTEQSTSSSDLLGEKGDSITLTGTGNTVEKFTNPSGEGKPFLISYEATGVDEYSSLSIDGVDVDGTENGESIYASSSSGPIVGTELMDKYLIAKPTTKLKISFDGDWKLEIKPLLAAAAWDGASPLKGSGPDVVIIDGGLSSGVDIDTTFDALADGSNGYGNITFYGPSSFDESLSILGSAEDGGNTMPKATLIVTIDYDGGWTITPG